MKKIVVLALFVSVAFISCKNDKPKTEEENIVTETETTPTEAKAEDGVFKVVPETSTLNWLGKKPTGSHNGTVAVKEGNLVAVNGNLTGGTITFDMTSMVVLDIPADDESNGKLLNHLKSADFFDVTAHPTSTFVITNVVNGAEMVIKGDLTIKGVTKSIEFPATLKTAENSILLTASAFKIDRTEFGIEYKSTKFFDNLKDKFINDDFEISFEINASK